MRLSSTGLVSAWATATLPDPGASSTYWTMSSFGAVPLLFVHTMCRRPSGARTASVNRVQSMAPGRPAGPPGGRTARSASAPLVAIPHTAVRAPPGPTPHGRSGTSKFGVIVSSSTGPTGPRRGRNRPTMARTVRRWP